MFVKHYTDPKILNNSEQLLLLSIEHAPSLPLEGPLVVQLRFVANWTQGARKFQRQRGCWPKCTKPDADNLSKQLLDVLQKAGFYRNDAQIARLVSEKVYADTPGVGVYLDVCA